MKPLIVLNSAFIAVLLASGIVGSWNVVLAGNAAMAVMMLFTALGHFIFPKGMEMMLPQFVPMKNLMVFLSGILEVLFAIGLLLPATREIAAICLIIFLIIVLPVNISAAKRRVDFEKANYSGKGINYLWIRIPLQIFFLLWVWYFGILAEK